jgi:hypothetical protein
MRSRKTSRALRVAYDEALKDVDAARTNEAQRTVLAGMPSKAALELMLSSFGWGFTFYDWRNAGISTWKHTADYQEGTRITVRIDCNSYVQGLPKAGNSPSTWTVAASQARPQAARAA